MKAIRLPRTSSRSTGSLLAVVGSLAAGLCVVTAGCSSEATSTAQGPRRIDVEIAKIQASGKSAEEIKTLTALARMRRQMGTLPPVGAIVKNEKKPRRTPRGTDRPVPR